MKILVVDDDQMIREMVKVALTKAGYEIELAENGEEAIEILQHKNYDMVITDLVMPKKDGVALMSHIQKQDLNIPVLVISGGVEGHAKDFINYSGYFADDTLTKPFTDTLLLQAVEKLAANACVKDLLY